MFQLMLSHQKFVLYESQLQVLVIIFFLDGVGVVAQAVLGG
jgi:hypothetical protein